MPYSELLFCSFLQVHLEQILMLVRTKTIEIKSMLFFWMQLFNWSDLANQADLSDSCHHSNGRSLQSKSKEQVNWGGHLVNVIFTLFFWSILFWVKRNLCISDWKRGYDLPKNIKCQMQFYSWKTLFLGIKTNEKGSWIVGLIKVG